MHKPNISARAKRVWQKLVEWYGIRLVEQYGEAPPEDWCETVDGADNETVKRGLGSIRTKYVNHPPTFPQFDEAFAPIKAQKGPRLRNTCEILCEYVVTHYKLTPQQLRGPWTYIGKQFDAEDITKKMVEGHGYEITGVVIDADGDTPGRRIMVADMQAASHEWDDAA